MNFDKVKPNSTPNVNFPEIRVSKDLSLGVAFPSACVLYLGLNYGREKERYSGKATIAFLLLNLLENGILSHPEDIFNYLRC